MKKFILSALVALFGFAAASAQGTIFNNPANRAYFGVRVGADITCPGNIKSGPLSIDMFGNGAGIEFGGIYNIPLVANLYIEPGVKLFYDTYPVDDLVSGDGELGTEVDMSIRKFGMRIPVMFGYHFDFTPMSRSACSPALSSRWHSRASAMRRSTASLPPRASTATTA